MTLGPKDQGVVETNLPVDCQIGNQCKRSFVNIVLCRPELERTPEYYAYGTTAPSLSLPEHIVRECVCVCVGRSSGRSLTAATNMEW